MSKFKVGDVCIWQNLVGFAATQNGLETTITGVNEMVFDTINGVITRGYVTDTVDPRLPGKVIAAREFQLRLKRPPATGETMIREMFNAPALALDPA